MSCVYKLSVLISKGFRFCLFIVFFNLCSLSYGQSKYSNKKKHVYFDNGVNLCKEVKVSSRTVKIIYNFYYVNFTDKYGAFIRLINFPNDPGNTFMVSKKEFMKENFKSIYFKRHLINLNFDATLNKFRYDKELYIIDLLVSTKDSLNIKKVNVGCSRINEM